MSTPSDDFRETVDRLFKSVERRIDERISEAADEDGLIPAVVADRIIAEEFGPVAAALDQACANATARGLDSSPLRKELAPIIALLRKRVLDLVRPH